MKRKSRSRAAAAVQSLSRSVVSDSCDPMDCNLPGSSPHGISQARILEWVGISFSRDLPNPEIKPGSPAQKTDSLPSEPPGKPKVKNVYHALNVFGKGKKSYRTTDRKHRF